MVQVHRAKHWRALAYAAALACASLAGVAHATPNARFTATPLQGGVCVAPCAVHFDAIGDGADETTDAAFPRAFHSLIFYWEFDDPSAGTWAVSGRSRNEAIGAIAGHLFERPGTYRVRLTATNPHGESDVVEEDVVVADPDLHFGASNTWCFANTGSPGGAGFEACPTPLASRHVVIPPAQSGGFELALSSTYCRASSQKARCLFRAGDRFDANALVSLSGVAGAGLLSRFGDGPDPRVEGGSGFAFVRNGWTVAGFDVSLATSGGSYPLFRVMQQERGVTLANVRARNLRGPCVETETGVAPLHNDRIGIIGLDCLNTAGGGSLAGLFLRGERILVMGNVVDDAYEGQFVLRTVHFPWSVLQHNRLVRPSNDPSDQRNVIQIRAWAANQAGSAQPPPTPTRFVLISDNHLGQDNSSVFVRTCQTNDCNDGALAQDVSDVVIERNFLFFTAMPGGLKTRMPHVFQIQGGDVTVRDNIVDLQGIDAVSTGTWDRLVEQQANMASTPARNDDRIHVFNNAVYYDESVSRGFQICTSYSAGIGHRCQNNLVVLPNHSGSKSVDDGPPWSSSNNVLTSTSPFAGAVPNQGSSSPTSFQLAPSATVAVDAGYDFGVEDAGTRLDFAARCRPADGADADTIPDWDIGPWEQASSLDCIPSAVPEPGGLLAGLMVVVSLALRVCHSARRAVAR